MSETTVTPEIETHDPGTDPGAIAAPTLPTLPHANPAPPPPPPAVAEPALPAPGSAPMVPPAPAPTPSAGTEAASLPLASPVLTDPGTPMQPYGERFEKQRQPVDDAMLPTLPTAAPAVSVAAEDEESTPDTEGADASDHPMAHLMPPKSKPTEASTRAAALRAEKKAKARKIKLAVAAVALVVAVLAGPPLFSWLSNAVNEAGGTTTEEPTD